MNLLNNTKQKIMNVSLFNNTKQKITSIFDSNFFINGFIGVSVVILGYYTFFENNIEIPVDPKSVSKPEETSLIESKHEETSTFDESKPEEQPLFDESKPEEQPLFESKPEEQPLFASNQKVGGNRKKTKKRK
jgi:hypothetical protein